MEKKAILVDEEPKVKKPRAKTQNSIQNIGWDELIAKKAALSSGDAAAWDKRLDELIAEFGASSIKVFNTLRKEMNEKYKWVEVSKKSSNGVERFKSTHKK